MQEHRTSEPRGRRRSDQILEGWTWGRAIKILTALTLLGGVVTALVSVGAATIATKPQLDAVVEKVDTLRVRTDQRFQRLEARQDATEQVHDLLPAFFRLQCIQLEQIRSASLAEAAGFPCDSLLRRHPR